MSNELPRDAYTEFMYDELYDGAPVSPDNAEEIIAGIRIRSSLLKTKRLFILQLQICNSAPFHSGTCYNAIVNNR